MKTAWHAGTEHA